MSLLKPQNAPERDNACPSRRARRVGGLLLAAAVAACNPTPTEITPLPRAIGEVEAVRLRTVQLAPLDPATEGIYALYSVRERSQTALLGTFNVDASGQVVDENGAPKTDFTTDEHALRSTLSVLVTIEIPDQVTQSPNGFQILSGTFVDSVAQLRVPISSSIQSAAGTLRVHTPTDGPDTNETSGVWMHDLDGEPSLQLPDTTAALQYELFIDVGGRSLPVGRFEAADQADSINQYSSDQVGAPARPGEDLLVNAPEGLVFPVDLSGARVTISLESRFTTDFVQRSQLIVLEAFLPGGLRGDDIVTFINRTGSFPSGEAVLY